MSFYHNTYVDPEAYAYDCDRICAYCYAKLSKKQKAKAIPQFNLGEWEHERGEGVGCTLCLEWIQEPTKEYQFQRVCKEQGIYGLLLAPDYQDAECIPCAAKWNDSEPEHERLKEDQIARLVCWDCERPLSTIRFLEDVYEKHRFLP